MGLSMGHISPFGSVEFWKGGQFIKAQRPKYKYAGKYGGGKRGCVTRFSYKSRRRLMNTLGKVQKRCIPLFLTLTYPAIYPNDPRAWKRHLDVFVKRMERRFPDVGGFWKLEEQKRGAPHFHLILWGVEYAHMLCWVSRAWYEVVSSGDEKHLRAGTRVETVRSWGGVMSYAAKYVGKLSDASWQYPGRFWGCIGRKAVPWGEKVVHLLTEKAACDLIRYLRRYCHIRARAYRSLSVRVGDASFWEERFGELVSL